MSNEDHELSDDVLLEICRVSRDHTDFSEELLADLRAVSRLVRKGPSPRGTQLPHAVSLMTAAVAKLPQFNPKHLPFGYDGPTIRSHGWIEREALERLAKQIVGLQWADTQPDAVANEVASAVSEAVKLGFLDEKDYDAWQPGMASGSGWRSALSATPYGVTKARSLATAPTNTMHSPHPAAKTRPEARQLGDHDGWSFDALAEGEVRARNEELCREYAGLAEHDLLSISARWRQMVIQFTESTKRSGHYHGYIVHVEEVQRVTKLLETAVSQYGIDGVSRLGRCLRRPDDDHLHWALVTLDELDAKLRAKAAGKGMLTENTMKRTGSLHADGLNRAEVLRCISAFRRARWDYEDSLQWVHDLSHDAGSGDAAAERHRATTRDYCSTRNVNAGRQAAETFPVIMRQAELLGFDVSGLRAAIARNPWGPDVLRDVELLVNRIEERLTADGPATERAVGGVAVNTADHGVAVSTGGSKPKHAKTDDNDRYEYARQTELVKATNQVLGEGVLNPGVLSRACKGEIATNQQPGRGAMVQVKSFVAWLGKKRELPKEELDQVRNAIIGEISARK